MYIWWETGLSQNTIVQIRQMLGPSTCHKNIPCLHDYLWFMNGIESITFLCQKSKLKQLILKQLTAVHERHLNLLDNWALLRSFLLLLSADTPWHTLRAKNVHKVLNDWFQWASVRLHLQYPWRTGGYTWVCDWQSLPMHHTLEIITMYCSNFCVDSPLSNWSFLYFCIISVATMHSIYRERGNEKWEGNKQVIVHSYRQRLQEAIIHSVCEYHFNISMTNSNF